MARVILLPILAEPFPFYGSRNSFANNATSCCAASVSANTLAARDHSLFVIAKLCFDTTVLLPATVAMAL
eukprot:scaffold9348_cov82-Cyclotella_meneghiniana.AAC.3